MSTATQTTRQKLAPIESPAALQGRQKLLAAVSFRFGRLYLEAQRLFRVWAHEPTNDNLKRYTKTLRRLDSLQAAERSLAA